MPYTRIAENIIECAEKNDVTLTKMRWGVAHNILLGLGYEPTENAEIAETLGRLWDGLLLRAVEEAVARAGAELASS
jgi:hypothetical protein